MIDSHAHIDDEAFDEDRIELIKNLKSDGLDFIVNIGADLESSKNSLKLASENENIFATVGVHPHYADKYDEKIKKEIIKLAEHKKVVAIGEIGLDYHFDNSPTRDEQKRAFIDQIEIAHNLKLPVVVHSRDASLETYEILKDAHKKYDFVALIHCYSQSVDMLKKYLDMGDYIALGGAVTFKNAKTPKEVAKVVPLDRLLLETDCPYMSPTPFRGKRNEPKFIRYTAEYIAKLRDIDTDYLIEITDNNTKRFYNI